MNVRFENRNKLIVAKLLGLAIVLLTSFSLLHSVKSEQLHAEFIDITEQIVKKRREAKQLQIIRELKRCQGLKAQVDELVQSGTLPADFQLVRFDSSEGVEGLEGSRWGLPKINSTITQTDANVEINLMRDVIVTHQAIVKKFKRSEQELTKERHAVQLKIIGLTLERVVGSIYADHGQRLIKILNSKIHKAYRQRSVQESPLVFESVTSDEGEASTTKVVDSPAIDMLVKELTSAYLEERREFIGRVHKSVRAIIALTQPFMTDTDKMNSNLLLNEFAVVAEKEAKGDPDQEFAGTNEGLSKAFQILSKGTMDPENFLDKIPVEAYLYQHDKPAKFYLKQKDQTRALQETIKQLIQKDRVINLLNRLVSGGENNLISSVIQEELKS